MPLKFSAIFLGILLSTAISSLAQNEFCDVDNVLECTALSAKKLAKDYQQIFSIKQNVLRARYKEKSLDLILFSESAIEAFPEKPLTYPIHYWADRNWLLIKQFSNGGEIQNFIIIDLSKDFNRTVLNGTPIFSPDRKKILAYGADIYAGLSANGIAIYDINESNQLTEVFKVDADWGVVTAEWKNNTHILLSTIMLCGDEHPDHNVYGECTSEKKLELINNQWQLSPNE